MNKAFANDNEINGMIDIHSHVIYGVDDGSETKEESIEMLEKAYELGTRAIICTPHHGEWNEGYDHEKAISHLNELKAYLAVAHPDMKLFIGNEFYVTEKGISTILSDIAAGKASGLAGSHYVLIEFSTKANYQTILGAVRALGQEGYFPIIAHVERYDCLFKKLDLIEELRKSGAGLQINAGALIGGRFDKKVKWVNKIIDEGLADYVASDMHDNKNRPARDLKAFERYMKQARKVLL